MKRLLDLFCKAGGASMGYHMAGFEVVGVDKEPQPNYPFEFIKADALTVDLSGFDAYAASPPCQGYSITQFQHPGKFHPQLIYPVRDRLRATGKPYVIENVELARDYMYDPVTLCGSSFGLRVRRHRVFETSGFRIPQLACNHAWQNRHKPYRLHLSEGRGGERQSGMVPVYGGNQMVGGNEKFYKSVAMGIDWMDPDELNEAIPPAYTLHIGKALMKQLA
jgi:DNA (cytosine-5)-methyltransferase 1